MPRADYFKPGSWNALCDRCGRKFKADELQKTWQGYYVCKADFEPRHPQDFVRAPAAEQALPWVRFSAPQLIASMCDMYSVQAIAGVAVPGCAIPGRFLSLDLGDYTPIGESEFSDYNSAGGAIPGA